MQKLTLFSMIVLMTIASTLAAIDTSNTPIWQIKANKSGQNFIKNDDKTRSIALNKSTDHLLVATRLGTHRIVVLRAATGDSVAQLKMIGVTGGTLALNKLAVADDGVIYACNQNTGNGFKIYRWQDESATPSIATDTTLAGITGFGDTFALKGKGLNTKIYLSGNTDNSRVTILGTKDGKKFRIEKIVTNAPGRSTDIVPIESQRYWLKYPGGTAALYDESGTLIEEIDSDIIPLASSAICRFAYPGHYYLGVFDGKQALATGRLVQLGDEVFETQVNVIYGDLGTNANNLGSGAVVVDTDKDRFFLLASNNSISAFQFASYAIWPLVWRTMADTAAWFGTHDDVCSITYSAATEHLYVTSRRGGSFIKVFDPATGQWIKDLANAGIAGGTYPIHLITATADGQIFVGNLANNGEVFKLYHWSNEDAFPEPVFNGVLPGRVGDALTCSGAGRAVEVFVSGRDNNKIFTFTPGENTAFIRGFDIPLPENGAAAYGVSSVNGNDYFFISGPEKPVRYIKRDGTVLNEFDATEANGVSARYFEVPTFDGIARKFLLVASGWKPGISVIELFGEDGENLCSYYERVPAMTPSYAQNANLNATAQAVYEVNNNHIIEISTNNGLSTYSFANIEPNAGIPAAEIIFSTDLLDFGRVDKGNSKTLSFWATNVGTAPWAVNRISTSLDFWDISQTSAFTLNVGDTLHVIVAATPDSAGFFTDSIIFWSEIGNFEIILKLNTALTIADAKIDADADFVPDLKGMTVTVQGIITTPNYWPSAAQYYLQDETGGISMFFAKSAINLSYGDEVVVTGVIEQIHGLTEIVPFFEEDVQQIGSGNITIPKPVSKELLGEETESQLVQLFRYRILDATKWPGAGKEATVQFTNGLDTIDVFIDKDMGISGSPAPTGPCNLVGVVDQNTNKVPADIGYQLRPRGLHDFLIITAVDGAKSLLPEKFQLHQNYPNPFNPETSIVFDAPEVTEVKIKVFDILGKEIATVYEGNLMAGYHKFQFNGADLPSGIYFYRVESKQFVEMKKMTLVK